MSEEQWIFMCEKHRFVIVVRRDEITSRGTPGHRVTGCETCDAAVDAAFDRMEEPADA